MNYTITPAGSKAQPHYVIEDVKGTHHLNDMFFDSPEEALKYAKKKGVNIVDPHKPEPEDSGHSPGMR